MDYTRIQKGETDRERILLCLLENMNALIRRRARPLNPGERFAVLEEMVFRLSPHNKLNLLIYDGEVLYIHTNYKDSLYIREQEARIFSNSVLLGEAEEYICYRDILWENSTHGINPHNVGAYEYIFKDTDELLDYIQSTSIYCAEREGKYVNFSPLPLRDYSAQDEIEGEYYENGKYHKLIITPEKEDLEYLRSFKHEDLTFRGTIEFRSVCCQPAKDAMTVAAFHVGLKTRLHELTELLENDKIIYGHGYNPTELRHLFIQKELSSFVNADEVYQLCEKVLDIAKKGLLDRGFGEERFLEPLFDRVRSQESPGAYVLRRLSEGMEIEEVIKEYAKIS